MTAAAGTDLESAHRAMTPDGATACLSGVFGTIRSIHGNDVTIHPACRVDLFRPAANNPWNPDRGSGLVENPKDDVGGAGRSRHTAGGRVREVVSRLVMTINNTPGCRVIASVNQSVPGFARYRVECCCERQNEKNNLWRLRFLRPTARECFTPDSIATLIIGRRFHYAHRHLTRHLARVLGVAETDLTFCSAATAPGTRHPRPTPPSPFTGE